MKGTHFTARLIRQSNSTIVNLCDEELIGQVVRGDGLELNVSRDFFGGELVDGEEALALLKKSEVANLAGNRIVEIALGADLASADAVKTVGGTSFLMIFNFSHRDG